MVSSSIAAIIAAATRYKSSRRFEEDQCNRRMMCYAAESDGRCCRQQVKGWRGAQAIGGTIMTMPKIASLLGLAGVLGMIVASILGTSAAADYVLVASFVCLVL